MAVQLGRNGVVTALLARTEQEASELREQQENARFLPGVAFPNSLAVTSDVEEAVSGASMVVLAVPSHSFRQNLLRIRDSLTPGQIVLSASKGLEKDTSKRMSQIMGEELPEALAATCCVLSGPNLAMEIVAQKPSSTVVAGSDPRAAAQAQELLMSQIFRVYTNEDVVGVELGGALKNIIAIGCGITDGLKYGDNAKAGLITRGLAEITRLGVEAGANPLTFAGLAGLGDLVATCSSRLSRNHQVGVELAKGRGLTEILTSMKNVAEGVSTTSAAVTMARELGIEMPITQATYKVLFEGLEVQRAIAELMGRPPRAE